MSFDRKTLGVDSEMALAIIAAALLDCEDDDGVTIARVVYLVTVSPDETGGLPCFGSQSHRLLVEVSDDVVEQYLQACRAAGRGRNEKKIRASGKSGSKAAMTRTAAGYIHHNVVLSPPPTDPFTAACKLLCIDDPEEFFPTLEAENSEMEIDISGPVTDGEIGIVLVYEDWQSGGLTDATYRVQGDTEQEPIFPAGMWEHAARNYLVYEAALGGWFSVHS